MTLKTKIIVVAGGVISGVGKGIAAASIARILQEHGFSVTAVKIDPYINYDAGTLRPTEHGEVWVTDDGGEIDQDLGNYERFLGIDIPKRNNITTGQVYKEIIDKERRGEFLGRTVQFIPHVPEEIKRRIMDAAQGYDFAVVEIGGTIGDYENLPYLFAAKSLELELGWRNVCNVLVSYLPVPDNIGEMKTKPTQQAIRMLNETGIFPDFVLCRSMHTLDSIRKKKIETYANIDSEHIISAPDIKTIYKVPMNFEREGMGRKLLARFDVEARKNPDWSEWSRLVERIESPSSRAPVAIICKYLDIGDYSLADSYISIKQALEHAGAALGIGADIKWIDSKIFEKGPEKLEELSSYSGIIVPGGFGASGVEGKIAAIRFARENNIPYLGLCFGMQLAVVEHARSICGLQDAHTTEVSRTQSPVIDILPMQKRIVESSQYGGTMRLGAYAAVLLQGSRVLELYRRTRRLEADQRRIGAMKGADAFRLGRATNENTILERHRHRYEVNPDFVEKIESSGLVFSGFHDAGVKLMEFIELPKHKFFMATQAHPEFKSRLGDAAPLFLGFLEACGKA